MPRGRRKYFWTKQQDELLLRLYDGHPKNLKRLYRLLPYPRWSIRVRAQQFGLTRKKEPRWTSRDEEYLRRNIKDHTVAEDGEAPQPDDHRGEAPFKAHRFA